MSQSTKASSSSSDLLFYVGTYTTKGSKGIYTVRLNTKTGQLSEPVLAGETESPSFIVFHPTKPVLYAVNEVGKFEGQDGGGVTAFSVGKDTMLTKLNAENSKGGGPAYIAVDRTGSAALVANYGGGTVALLPIDADGKLKPATAVIKHEGKGADPKRQTRPHAHSINVDPSGHYAIAADLGIDKLLVYRFDAKAGTLTPNEPPSVATAPGAGPRHVAFHPNGKFAYGINELASTIDVYTWDAKTGVLTPTQNIKTLPAEFTEASYTAEVQVHPSGKFVYGSNRGHDSIAIFSVNEKDGHLTFVGTEPTQGKYPRNFRLDPSGQFLIAANQNSDSIVAFRVDQQTGKLTPTGSSVTLSMPVCIKFAPGASAK